MRAGPVVALAGGAMLAALTADQGLAEIGTVGAINKQMTGTRPISEPTLLIIGDPVVQDELIESTETGSGQLLFLDQTTLTVAPKTSILLDRYVFDPDRGTGEVAMSVAKGAIRFIGGKITKGGEGTIRTPLASIGVRGGMAITEVFDEGVTKVTNLASSFVVVAQSCDADGDGFDDGNRCEVTSSVTLSRPGATAVAGPDGVKYTGLASAEELEDIYSALEGGGTGGLNQPPTLIRIVEGSRQVAPVNSLVVGGAYAQPIATTGETLFSFLSQDPIDPNTISENLNSVAERLANEEDLLVPDDMLNRPDPSVVAALTGTAIYSGPATGTETITASQTTQLVNGGFDMIYDFGSRTGAIDFRVLDTTFTADIAANPNNAADYSGNNPVFGGPDSISVDGGFFTGPGDPVATTAGQFEIDLPSRGSQVNGEYQGNVN